MEEELLGSGFIDDIIAGDGDLLGAACNGAGAGAGACFGAASSGAGDASGSSGDSADWCHWTLSPVRPVQVGGVMRSRLSVGQVWVLPGCQRRARTSAKALMRDAAPQHAAKKHWLTLSP